MSDLVENSEDRFSRVAGNIVRLHNALCQRSTDLLKILQYMDKEVQFNLL